MVTWLKVLQQFLHANLSFPRATYHLTSVQEIFFRRDLSAISSFSFATWALPQRANHKKSSRNWRQNRLTRYACPFPAVNRAATLIDGRYALTAEPKTQLGLQCRLVYTCASIAPQTTATWGFIFPLSDQQILTVCIYYPCFSWFRIMMDWICRVAMGSTTNHEGRG